MRSGSSPARRIAVSVTMGGSHSLHAPVRTGMPRHTTTIDDSTTARRAAPEPAIAYARGLSKTYGSGDTEVRALDGIDVDFVRGEPTAIMGPPCSVTSDSACSLSRGSSWLGCSSSPRCSVLWRRSGPLFTQRGFPCSMPSRPTSTTSQSAASQRLRTERPSSRNAHMRAPRRSAGRRPAATRYRRMTPRRSADEAGRRSLASSG